MSVWAHFVKTGVHKERAPTNDKWWFVRAASVLRSIYKLGPVGVSKLTKKYGGRKRRGHQPPEFRPASGNILRKILQQLEKETLVKQNAKGVHKGRIVTTKGKSFLDTIAGQVYEKISVKAANAEKTEEPKTAPVEKKKKAEKTAN